MTAAPSALPPQSEASFQDAVCDLATLLGYRWYHTNRSDRSPAGFPDLVLVRPASKGRRGRVIFAELKAHKKTATREQAEWLRALLDAGAEAHLWRPDDFERIAALLR